MYWPGIQTETTGDPVVGALERYTTSESQHCTDHMASHKIKLSKTQSWLFSKQIQTLHVSRTSRHFTLSTSLPQMNVHKLQVFYQIKYLDSAGVDQQGCVQVLFIHMYLRTGTSNVSSALKKH